MSEMDGRDDPARCPYCDWTMRMVRTPLLRAERFDEMKLEQERIHFFSEHVRLDDTPSP